MHFCADVCSSYHPGKGLQSPKVFADVAAAGQAHAAEEGGEAKCFGDH